MRMRSACRQMVAVILSIAATAFVVACTSQSASPTAPSGGSVGSLAASSTIKGVICHATGAEGNPFVGIEVSVGSNTGFPISNNGHLDENGNPLSGHEQDVYLGVSPPAQKSDCEKKEEPPK